MLTRHPHPHRNTLRCPRAALLLSKPHMQASSSFIHVCEHSSLSNPVLHPCLGILIYYVSHQGFRHTHMFVQPHSFQLISASIFGSGFSPSLAVETNILPPAGCLGPTGPEKPGAGPRICLPSPQPGCVCWGCVGGGWRALCVALSLQEDLGPF